MKFIGVRTLWANFTEAGLNSYAQVFFSKNKVLAILLLVVSFFDYTAGCAGLLAVVVSILFANMLGLSTVTTQSGQYGFNNLLMGLALGFTFEPSIPLFATVVIASVFTTFVTIAMQGWLTKYGLPYLSLPFIVGTWISLIAASRFTVLGLSARDIYNENALYALGGKWLHEMFYNFEMLFPQIVTIYFKALGAIFFQFNVVAGVLIAIGLLIYSRMAFVLSILGYFVALAFYKVMGIDLPGISYTYIGFNYILTSIALGGYYLVPGRGSFAVSFAMLPIVGLITLASESIFAVFQLSVYSLPFNVTVLLFLYILKYRTKETFGITEVPYQHFSPERNFYFNYLNRDEKKKTGFFNLSLPFYGEWTVSQGHDGEFTHKNEWKHAWDFEIYQDGKQFANDGNVVTDYFCYGKPVLASADGIIVEVVDGIADNAIGEMNILRNWGNSIVIYHLPGVYTQLSHLKNGSIKVKKGDSVIKGQPLATLGNSGRSPYPHLHFQVQAFQYVGSKTIKYPIGNYLTNDRGKFDMKFFDLPQSGEKLINPTTSPLLVSAFTFVPGQSYRIKVSGEGSIPVDYKKLLGLQNIEILTDSYNNSCFFDTNTGEKAYFGNDGSFHTFLNFDGRSGSFLKLWSLVLKKVYMGYYQQLEYTDSIPVHFMFRGPLKILHDIIAPLYSFIRTTYFIRYVNLNEDFTGGNATIEGEIFNNVFNVKRSVCRFNILLNENGIQQIVLVYSKFILNFECKRS